jgi:hypothetical protein
VRAALAHHFLPGLWRWAHHGSAMLQ